MADTAVFYLPIPLPSSLRGPQFDEDGLSQLQQSMVYFPSLLYTSQWPCIFRQMRLKKTAGDSRKALTSPDKGQRHCLVPPSFFSLLVVIARAAAAIMGPWEKGQKNHKEVFHPWTSLNAWTNIVQQVNIMCKITKQKTKKNLTPLLLSHYELLICFCYLHLRASLVVQMVKNLPAMWDTWVWSLGWQYPLEKGKATHSSILARRIPWIIHGVRNSQTRLSDFHFTSIWGYSFLCVCHII